MNRLPTITVIKPRSGSQAPTSTSSSGFSAFGLHPRLAGAVAVMGITDPTPIQSQAIPALMAGRDVMGQARTGSGKTLAFALPLVTRCDQGIRAVQALVLVPTRELAIQVGEVTQRLAQPMGLRMTLLYGGRSLQPEKAALAAGVHIVVGTPGRILDHLRQGTLSLKMVRFLVLDEGDEMLDRGFGPDVERILSHTPSARQSALLSATVPDWVVQTAARHLKDPLLIRADVELEAPPEIEHTVYEMDPGDKLRALRSLLDRQGSAPIIVFGRTKHGVKKLARQLDEMGYSVAALQGNLSQNARERVMSDFRAGQVRVLLATNVAARGLDIEGVEQVINYELPESAELFTHRAGRTGRMGRSGEAVTFLTAEDAPKWRQIERALGKRLSRMRWRSDSQASPDQQPVPAPRPVAAVARRPQAPMRVPGRAGLAPRRSPW